MRSGRRRLRLSRMNDDQGHTPCVLLISPPSSYRVAPYIEAAKQLGIEAIVVSQGEHSLVGAIAGGIHVDLRQPEKAADIVLAAVGERAVRGVVGTDDFTVGIAAHIAAQLGFAHNSPASALLSRRKDLARQCLQKAGAPVPHHWRIDLRTADFAPALAAVGFPCVVKPLALSGSRGVIRANDAEQLRAACARVAAIIADDNTLTADERRYVLVEQFIDGPEVALEGMLHRGRLQTLAVFDKPDELNGPFFEETYYVTPSRLPAPVLQQIERAVADACGAYGLREGPVHAELRVNDGRAWIMEVAARTIGGQCARLLRFGTGHSLEQLVLAQAIGAPLAAVSDTEAAGVLMLPTPRAGLLRRVEGVLQAKSVRYIEDVEISVREGYELVPLPEGASYLGFIFARAPSAAQAEQALRDAHACLKVVTAPVFGRNRVDVA